ncbi:hypothetical protein CCR75_002011 [Bremia lactucae]|uniref:FYVE-type domain-containing protein n=1 Tax=Bremia lactucae TaxID=4779 RepID=A0A976FHU1_BRELC|nr:hypothetical protein CCR75_002011 [Bremia lactucae]
MCSLSNTSSTKNTPLTSVRLSEEDNALFELTRIAREKVEKARQDFATAGWMERKDGQGVRTFERKSTPGVVDIAAFLLLPCSVSEIMEVLSNRNSDDFNTTMIALAGDVFSYAVTLREVTTSSINIHLSTKRMQFSGSIPLLSSAKTFEFLDFVDVDYKTRTAIRLFQTLRQNCASQLVEGGGTTAGFMLTEQTQLHQTTVFYFGTDTTRSDEVKHRRVIKTRLKAGAVRESSTLTLLKLAKLIPMIGDIALRRRLGAVKADYSFGFACDGCCSGCGKVVKNFLMRKKYVCVICGYKTCGPCSLSQDIEGLVGVTERLRVCCMCISAARNRAFGTIDDNDDTSVHLPRPTTFSTLSTTRTDSMTNSGARHSARGPF